MRTVVCSFGDEKAVKFAGEELSKYLSKAMDRKVPVVAEKDILKSDKVIRVGTCQKCVGIPLGENVKKGVDAIGIRINEDSGMIIGTNPRSVLFAVYRYLREIGFKWIRPGERGEIIPKISNPFSRRIDIVESATYPFRTICIEGACSYEHVRDLIDWSAKFGMNGYFIQFDLGLYFWRRWYEVTNNPYRRGRKFGEKDGRRVVEKIIGELKKRDLRLERMGHGWTCAGLGIAGEGWDQSKKTKLAPGKKEWVALVNGKRELWGGVALNTNLCYSNPKVRSSVTDAIVGYSKKNPDVDAIHFWLADGSNNNCECNNCKKERPSDLYVKMLNELDAKLTKAGLNTKIVFLIYVDLLWPPAKEKIKNQERFVIMFAPITRSYRYSFLDSRAGKEKMTPYVRNKLQFPRGVNANIEYLKQWKKMFNGRGFDFDYHMIWAIYYDMSQFALSSVLHKDLQDLGKIGLDGFNSCQNQRVSFPNNLLLDVLARTLWNKNLTFDKIVKETFPDAYGEDGVKVANHFRTMSALWSPFFEPVYTPEKDEKRIGLGLNNIPKMTGLINSMDKLVSKNVKKQKGAVLWSWKYLNEYLNLMELLLPACESYLKCSPETKEKYEKVFDFVRRREKAIHPALDVSTFINTTSWRVNEVTEEIKKREKK